MKSPIVQYWHAAPPDWVQRGLDSFSGHNSGRPHLVFDEESAGLFIEARLGRREAAAFRRCAVPAMQADYFRYCAIFALGGLYADADLLCLADLRPLIDRAGGTLFGRGERPSGERAKLFNWPHRVGPYYNLANTVFAFPEPGHPALALAVAVATANVEARIADGWTGIWLTTGPGIFTSMYLVDRLGSFEEFLRYANGTILESTAELFCAVSAQAEHVSSAIEGVSLLPRETEGRRWFAPAPEPKARDRETPHWTEVEGSIFR